MIAASPAVSRWEQRRVASFLLRAVALLVPLAVGLLCGYLVARLLPRPDGPALFGWWFAVLGATTLGLVVTERLARRLLPLSALLRLTLVFPDQAPSRMSVAVRSMNVRRLQALAQDVTRTDVDEDFASRATTLLSLAAALNAHDRRTRGHSERVRVLTALVAEEMDLDDEAAARLQWAALLHDIGKLTVPASILNKPGEPDDREWQVLQRHPTEGARLAEPLHAWLGDWIAAIGEHHERFDGTGYPRGLSGEEISLAGRVVCVTDSFETMTALRSYNRPVSVTDAREELVRCAGAQFDPAVVRAFLQISLRRLHWAIGLLAWIAQIPLAGALARILRGFGGGEPAGVGAAAASTTALLLALGFSVPTNAGAGANPADANGIGSDAKLGAHTVGLTARGTVRPRTLGAGQAGSAAFANDVSNGPPLVPPGWTKPHPPGPANAAPPGRDPLPVPTSVPGDGTPGGGRG